MNDFQANGTILGYILVPGRLPCRKFTLEANGVL